MNGHIHSSHHAQPSKSRPRSKRIALGYAAAMLAAAATGALAAGSPTLPQQGGGDHLGVVTCAGSTCHGSAEPLDAAPVLQNEYLTWHRRDAHARAYETLHSDRSERIARQLGLGPAHEADTCLDCHADNVPEDRRGRGFQIADGIGCEACHGGAENWIRSHVSGEASHGDNVARGMYPTDQPGPRADLCLSCHYSHPDTDMTHRIMAAGHPPLQFELATFSRIQPPHYAVDEDYRARKAAPSAARIWAVGQLRDARTVLGKLRDDLYRAGLFPELYYFDCNACHHDFGATDWVSRPVGNLEPGSVRLEDASLRMASHLLAVLDPELARRWAVGLDELHDATAEDAATVRAAADRLYAVADAAGAHLEANGLADRSVVRAMDRIVAAGRRNDFGDRTSSDQTAMALAALMTTAREDALLPPGRLERLESALDRIYAALEKPRDYSPWRYREALRSFAEGLP